MAGLLLVATTSLAHGGSLRQDVKAYANHRRTADPDQRLTFRELRRVANGGAPPKRLAPANVLAVKAQRVRDGARFLDDVSHAPDRWMIEVPPAALQLSTQIRDLTGFASSTGQLVPWEARRAVARVLPRARDKFPRSVLVAPIDMPPGFRAALGRRSALLAHLSEFAAGSY